MKVVILAGGFGTRLGTQTDFIPKPMMSIGSHPMLWHIMKIYQHYGYNEFLICLGYRGDIIKEYFLNYPFYTNDFTISYNGEGKIHVVPHSKNKKDKIKVTLAATGLSTKTGSRILRIKEYIKEQHFMLTYGDGVADIDISALVKFHMKHKKIATLTGVYSPGRFGNLKLKGRQITEFQEKSRPKNRLINGGFYVFHRDIFNYLGKGNDSTIEGAPLEALSRAGQLMCYFHLKYWQCMDTTRDLELLNKLWKEKKARWKVWK